MGNKKAPEPVIFKKIETGTQEIRVERSFYKGHEFLSIRKYWLDDKGQFQPGKGVTFDFEAIDDIIDGLKKMQEYLDKE